jgi:CspA family cold shock protein
MLRGLVVKIFAEKGFGFIRHEPSNGVPVEFFFHCKALPVGHFALLQLGARVEFEPTNTERGPRAERVRIIG